MAMEITGLNNLGMFFVVVTMVGAVMALYLWKGTDKGLDPGRWATKLSVAFLAMGIVVTGAYFLNGAVFYNKEAVTEGPTGPQETIQKQNVGIVKGTIMDMYKQPDTYISDATISIGRDEPVAGDSLDALVDNTQSKSFTMTIPYVTSGTVYVTGQKNGYYPDVVSTTVPGASTYPSEDLYANLKLAQIEETPNMRIADNTGYVNLSGGTITVDNESNVQDFTLVIEVDDSYTALKNLQVLLSRGDAWDNVSGLSPMVSDTPSDISDFTEGDLTLVDSRIATVDFKASEDEPGYLSWGDSIEIRFRVDHDQVNSSELFTMEIDDLLGGEGIDEVEGWAGETLTVQTDG